MSLQRISEWGGGYHVSSEDLEITDGEFFGFTVQEDNTVVSIMSGGDFNNIPSPAIDFRQATKPGVNIVGKQLKAGAQLTIELNYIIKNFKCSAGSVILHKAQ